MSTSTFMRATFLALAGAVLLAPSIASAQRTEVSAVPQGAQRCADDFGTCTLPGNWTGGRIYYGAGNKFVEIPVGPATKPFVCHPQTFGIADPAPNVKKTCYALAGAAPAQAVPVAPAFPTVASVPQGALSCADDFGTCTPPANWASSSGGKLYYGASGRFVEIPVGPATKPFTCHPQTFGIPDPVPNVKKTCYLLAGPATQLKPIAMPNLATPANVQLAVEQPKAPVPVIIPVLMTDAQKAEYLRWTDAQREEFIQAYHPLTTDALRLELLSIRFNTSEVVTPTAYRSTTEWGGAAVVSAVPAGYVTCGTAGRICYPRNPKDYVFFGAGGKFAVALGAGTFTCAGKGTVKTPSLATPGDLGVDDPAPGAAKSCYTAERAIAVKAVLVKTPVGTPLAKKLQCKAGDVESQTGVCEGAATCPAPNAFITGSSTAVDELARRSFCGMSVAAQIPCPVAPAGLYAVTQNRTLCRHTPNCGDQTFDSGSNVCRSSQTSGDKVLSTLTNNLAGGAAPNTRPGCYDGFTYNSQTKLCEKNSTPSCPDGYLAVRVKTPESGYPDSCIQLNDRLVTCTDAHYLAQKDVRSAYFGGGATKCSYALPGFGRGF